MDVEAQSCPQSRTDGFGDEEGPQSETTRSEEIPDTKGAETQEGGEKENKEKTGDEDPRESIAAAAVPADTETTSSSNPVQKLQPLRGSHLSTRDKKIIEKIRSYYEAAEEAEEDDEDQQEAGETPRRRGSFSQIPSGLVKDSVSRFDVSGNQDETESEQPKFELDDETDGDTVEGKDLPAAASDHVTEDGQGNLDTGSSASVPTHEEQTPNPEGPCGQSDPRSPAQVSRPPEEPQEHESAEQPAAGGGDDAAHKSSPPGETQGKTQATWIRTKHRAEPTSPEGFPSQVNVGRWSRHSRIVTANRALFEGMGSDVASIRLFEATPAVDPVLMENSERILSKVQTLARMYSSKASNMMVPLHQKRASVARTHWGSAKPHPDSNSQSPVQCGTQASDQHQNSQPETDTEAKADVHNQPQLETSPTVGRLALVTSG